VDFAGRRATLGLVSDLMSSLRIGYGYDIHRLQKGRSLVLGGVTIASDRGLMGHSDADVVCHALADAVLGALADGDIGTHFPPGDDKWKNVNSLDLLAQVWGRASARGASLVNADITVVAEHPPLAPHYKEMRVNLAARLQSTPDRISVKATTNEGLGTEGRREGISASAVCLIELDRD
jgi:2-C-methyl-D-erythritol 2,4-cyclodiphosphate synthase